MTQDGLKDSRWPALAAAVHEWTEACCEVLRMARIPDVTELTGDNHPTIAPSPSGDLQESASRPVHSLEKSPNVISRG